MAYNNLSGTVFLPEKMTTSLTLPSGSFISGNLDYSDAAHVINVPRVTNATNNAILTNVAGDANTLTCESNLTFDGDTLNITGDLTASSGISASIFYGDGSQLTGISGGGGGSGAGIFTEIDVSKAYTTSSVTIGANSTPAHTMSVVGTSLLSGNVDVDGNIVPSAGDTYDLGSAAKPWRNLYISSSTIYFGTDTLSVGPDNNLKFGSGSTTKGFDVGFMNFKNDGIFMDPGRLFKIGAYQIQMFGGIGYVRKVVAANYSIDERDYLIGIQSNVLEASITLTLPAATGLLNGQTYVIKDEGGSINTHPVTVACTGSDTIDGQNSIVLESPYASVQLYCNGLNKFFIC